MKNESYLRELLQEHGLKVTLARMKVLDVLVSSPVALSHSDITHRLEGQEIDKVTLYRTLGAFTEKKLTHKVASKDRNWLYALHIHENEPAVDHDHAHFVCDSCEKIYCLPVNTEEQTPVIPTPVNFIVTSREYRLHGMCPDCH
ncbi:transcriptional repressor [Balneolaceae bacterium ANBcel3]|nr:transcriptional repressor [Balneolaceae bacterium ANBcel3]